MQNKNYWWIAIAFLVLPIHVIGEEVVLDTPQGVLLGESLQREKKNVFVFKGIPYAVPPVGVRRWKPAEAAPNWSGERLAKSFSPECMQPPFVEEDFHYRPLPQMSEDCLYLNIWAPERTKKKYPVMVWVHGGSLVEGAGSGEPYDGTELALKDVVVVTINYRLDVFGYFSHPQLTTESPNNASGNYGTTDQILALKWVRENIAAFGGDPNNVTIFGESAGALSVSHLLVSPLSKGLFHRAIAQSPYIMPMPALKACQYGHLPAEAVGVDVARHAGKQTLDELRSAPASDILQAAIDTGFFPRAVVDNWVFKDQMFRGFDQGLQHPVPVLVGYTSGEGYHLETYPLWDAPKPKNESSYTQDVIARYGNLAERYLAVYPPDDLREAVFAPVRDAFFGWAAHTMARASEKAGSHAYLYYFDHAPKWSQEINMGAFHSSEFPYMFNNIKHNLKYAPGWPDYIPSEADIQMAEAMSDYWVAFAKNGSPKVKGRPRWRPFTDRSKNYMMFKEGASHPKRELHTDAFELHEEIFSRRKMKNRPWGLSSIGLSAPVINNAQAESICHEEID